MRSVVTPFARLARHKDLPLGFSQETLLLAEEFNRYRSHELRQHHVRCGWLVRGPLSAADVESGLNAVIARHDGLRSAFWPSTELAAADRIRRIMKYAHAGPSKVRLYTHSVLDRAAITLRVEDLSHVASSECADQCLKIVDEETERPFDYARAPLLRAVFIKRAANEHVLAIVLHHLVCDRWSLGILERELQRHCLTAPKDQRRPVRVLSRHYPDFAVWQREVSGSDYFEPALEYWKRQWDAFASAEIDPSRIGRMSQSQKDARQQRAVERLVVDAERSADIRGLARASRITLFVLFLTCVGIVLREYTNARRLALWTSFANRVLPETPGMIGWFANSHLIGIDVDDTEPGALLITRVRDAVLNALTHQELPLSVLWQRFGQRVHGDVRVKVDVVSAGRGSSDRESAGPRIDKLWLPPVGMQADLDLRLVDRPDGLIMTATYDANSLQGCAVGEMLGAILRVAEAIVTNPRTRVAGLTQSVTPASPVTPSAGA